MTATNNVMAQQTIRGSCPSMSVRQLIIDHVISLRCSVVETGAYYLSANSLPLNKSRPEF